MVLSIHSVLIVCALCFKIYCQHRLKILLVVVCCVPVYSRFLWKTFFFCVVLSVMFVCVASFIPFVHSFVYRMRNKFTLDCNAIGRHYSYKNVQIRIKLIWIIDFRTQSLTIDNATVYIINSLRIYHQINTFLGKILDLKKKWTAKSSYNQSQILPLFLCRIQINQTNRTLYTIFHSKKYHCVPFGLYKPKSESWFI